MVAKQPEVTRRTRERMEAAFLELYRVKPIDRISVREITAKAGYSRASFYMYYDSVYGIREELETSIVDRFHEVVEAMGDDSGGLDLTHDVDAIVQGISEESEKMTVLLGPHGDPDFVERFKKEIWPTLVCTFGIDLGGLSATQRDFAREFYTSGIFAMARKLLADPTQMSVEEYGNFASRLVSGVGK